MERILTQDERIRRAEEIYYRRQNLRNKTKRATLNVSSEPKNLKLVKRVILQSVICALIYFIFYLVNTTNYSFSASAISKTEELISKDIDFVGICNNAVSWCQNYANSLNTKEESEENIENNIQEENTVDEQAILDNTEENTIPENTITEVDTSETTGQTEIQDVEMSETEKIKSSHSFILPISRNRNIRIWRT